MMKRRIFVFIMLFVLMMGVFPTTAMAAEIVDSGTDGGNFTWTLDQNNVLTISINDDAEDDERVLGNIKAKCCNEVKKIVIEEGITGFDENAFIIYQNLTSITLPESIHEISFNALGYCDMLVEIIVDDDNPNYSHENGVLFNKDKTVLLYVPRALNGSFVIPNSVTKIESGAFGGCSFDEIVIPNSVTSIGDSAFSGCMVNEITIPNSVSSIGDYAFAGCSINEITIPNSVTSIGDYAFFTSGINEIIIPDSVTSIGDYAFNRSSDLTSITIPRSVTSIGEEAFSSSEDLMEIVVAEDNPCYSSHNGGLLNKDKTELILIPSGISKYKAPESVKKVNSDVIASNRDTYEIEFTGDPPDLENVHDWGYGKTIGYPIDNENWTREVKDTISKAAYQITAHVSEEMVEEWKAEYQKEMLTRNILIGIVAFSILAFLGYKLVKETKNANNENSDN